VFAGSSNNSFEINVRNWPLGICGSFDSLYTLGLNDTNAAASDVLKSEVESAEFRANNHEDSKWLVWVLDIGQEGAIKTERYGYFSRLIEIGLEDVSNRSLYELTV